MKYKVIGQSLSATCPCSALLSVEKQVNDYIENGYVPRGNLKIVRVLNNVVAYQVMIKYKDEKTLNKSREE